jgi:predicted glycoside hydrolase/deacetylase ChbG (UPF0249 family)
MIKYGLTFQEFMIIFLYGSQEKGGIRVKKISAFMAMALIFVNLFPSDAERKAAAQAETRLIVRGDDLGMTEGSLEAFALAFEQGILTCGGLIVPGPWFEGAAHLCKIHPDWCIGVHLAVVGEWQGYRWRPVLPWDRVRSIVDEDGFLFASPSELKAHRPKLEDLDAEFRAQIDLAKKRGVNVQYLNFHYFGDMGLEGLDQTIDKIGRDYKLPFSGGAGESQFISVFTDPVEQKIAIAIKQLGELKPGLCLWVSHIGIDSPEQNALMLSNPEDVLPGDGVGKHRAAELRVLTHPDVKAVIEKKGIKLVNYGELSEKLKKSNSFQ